MRENFSFPIFRKYSERPSCYLDFLHSTNSYWAFSVWHPHTRHWGDRQERWAVPLEIPVLLTRQRKPHMLTKVDKTATS